MRFVNFRRMLQERDDIFLDRYVNYLLVGFLFVFVLFYSPLWFTHDVLLTHDAIQWFGSYYYVFDCLSGGHLPLWDPYGQSGNSFYQNINLLGLLEPISLFYIAWAKLWSTSILYSYVYMHMTRIVFMSIGAYLVYKYISGSRRSAKIAAVVFFMSLFSSSLHQNGFVNLFMTLPWILYCSLKYLDNINQAGSAKYLYATALFLGIAFNIYIPVYTLFYLFVFCFAAIISKAIACPKVNILFSREKLKEFAVATLILLSISAIPFTVYLTDMRTKGESYPYLRNYSSNSAGLVKEDMTSAKSGTALGDQYHKEDQISGTPLNLVQLVAPFYWEIRWQLSMSNNFQETLQFIGIASILIIICTLKFKSKFRNSILITTLVIIMAMTATSASAQTNIWHTIFKIIFPPLELIRVYESFLGGHLFNLGLLLAIGLNILEKEDYAEKLYKERLYLKNYFVFCLLIYILSYLFITKNIADSGEINNFLFKYSADLHMHMQTLIYLIVVSVVLYLVVAYKHTFLSHYGTYYCITAIILLEVVSYNWPGGFNKFHLAHNYLKDDDPVVHRPKPDIYDSFRSIYIPAYFRFVTFQEALQKKGAVYPDVFHYMGNAVFTSKRYYELITHVPKENIFAIAGITSPKTKFFESAYITNSRKDVLEKLSQVQAASLDEHILFIETERPKDFEKFKIESLPIEKVYQKQILPFENKNPFDRIMEVFPTKEAFFAIDFREVNSEEAKEYGFPEDWRLYVNDKISVTKEFDNLSTINNSNRGKVIILKENKQVFAPDKQPLMAGVFLNGISKTQNPVFLQGKRSYGDLNYRKEESGPPIEIFTMVDGKVVATKPFDGYLLLDTIERKTNDVNKEIKNTYFSPNKVSFSMNNQKPGFFYYSDGWSKYWKAYDNGQPTEVLKANYNYKAVFLPAGEHIVTFVFSPSYYIGALAFYFSGLFIGITLTIILFIRDRRPKRVL